MLVLSLLVTVLATTPPSDAAGAVPAAPATNADAVSTTAAEAPDAPSPVPASHDVATGADAVAPPTQAPATGADPAADGELNKPIGALELISSFARGMLMLCVVLFIAWLSLSKGLGKLVEKANAGKRMRVVERVALDARRTLYLVEIDGKQLIFGGGDVVKLHDVSGEPASFSAVLHAATRPPAISAPTPAPTSAASDTETA